MGMEPLNGKTGEFLRYLLGLALAAIVSYYTAMDALKDAVSATNSRVSVIESREQQHFEEVQRSLSRIERAIERIEGNGVDRRTGEPFSLQRQFDK
jgi:translation initiation factor 2B subunit (eIF-2B alpha/beta/delta family)